MGTILRSHAVPRPPVNNVSDFTSQALEKPALATWSSSTRRRDQLHGRGGKRSQHLWNGGESQTHQRLLCRVSGAKYRRCGAVGGAGGVVGGVSRQQIEQHVSRTFGVMFIFMHYEANKIWMRQKKKEESCIARVTLRRVCRKLKKEATDKSVLP